MLKKLLVYGVLVSMLGCAGGGLARNKVLTLQRSIDSYIAALRWSRVDEAIDYHREQDGARPLTDADAMQSIRVTGHNISNKTINEDLTEATVIVELEYYNEAYGTVKKLTMQQQWWYDDDSGRWFLSNAFPGFR